MRCYISTCRYIFPLLLISFLLSSIVVHAQTTDWTAFESASDMTKSLERKFRRDAARLALRMEAEKEDLRYQGIAIPQSNVEMVFAILSTIYESEETAKSIAKCNVHTFPDPSIDQFVIIYERDIDWAAPLLDGINETDSEDFNDLLYEYELIIDKHVSWNDTHDAITIRSKGPLNIAALSNEFYNIDGVEEIDLGIPKVAGNDIQFNRVADGWEVEYILKFGALSGKGGKNHTWKYEAKDSGVIQFIKEDGAPIPSWMRCQLEKMPLALGE